LIITALYLTILSVVWEISTIVSTTCGVADGNANAVLGITFPIRVIGVKSSEQDHSFDRDVSFEYNMELSRRIIIVFDKYTLLSCITVSAQQFNNVLHCIAD
jgi:hypothetical protein